MKEFKINLPEEEIPQQWYNVCADLPFPLDPPIHPGTKKPLGPPGPAGDIPQGPDRAGDEWCNILILQCLAGMSK